LENYLIENGRPLISIVTPCYNEEGNVCELYYAVKEQFEKLGKYNYEHIYIDNCSTDGTPAILEELAAKDKNVKVIFNSRNFGHIRSPYYALLQANGDAVIQMASDFQDPPEMIGDFIAKWEEGYKVVVGVKPKSKESPIMFLIRKMYYSFVRKLSEVELIDNFTGFGLYDKKIINILRDIKDPYPYLRGLICEIGFERAVIEFEQPRRKRGITKNNFFTLYDIAVLGITSYSKVPLRLATIMGFLISIISLLVAVAYFVVKLIWWSKFSLGLAPLVIGLFFFSSVQLFFIGVMGEYIGNIFTRVSNRPIVIEKNRLNFNNPDEKLDNKVSVK
jgi:glycosyltransferase involved in cell wall biosynthesis